MPFETGATLGAPFRAEGEDQLEDALAHTLTHAWVSGPGQMPPAWLDEGGAYLIGTLWLEKHSGRSRALESLEAPRVALALTEPPSPGENPGQPLTQAWSPAYYRTKAAYVLWMLRDMAGDSAFSAALSGFYASLNDPKAGDPPGTPDSPNSRFEKLLEHASKRDLSWFFQDWVNADKGLPDLTIDGVFPEAAQAGNTLVAVNVANSGYASAEVPVTVSAAGPPITRRLIVPGRGKATVRILVPGKPTQVQVNDGSVPETEATIHIRTLAGAISSQQSPSPQ